MTIPRLQQYAPFHESDRTRDPKPRRTGASSRLPGFAGLADPCPSKETPGSPRSAGSSGERSAAAVATRDGIKPAASTPASSSITNSPGRRPPRSNTTGAMASKAQTKANRTLTVRDHDVFTELAVEHYVTEVASARTGKAPSGSSRCSSSHGFDRSAPLEAVALASNLESVI